MERKARFIGQVMRGHLDVREIEDIGDTALSYSVIWTRSSFSVDHEGSSVVPKRGVACSIVLRSAEGLTVVTVRHGNA